MIIGVGVDVVGVARLAAALQRTPSLRGRLFADAEADLADERLAARLAAKEATGKALGGGYGGAFRDVEVVTGAAGRPELLVGGATARRAAALGVTRWHVSLSHDAGVATALVLAEGAATAGSEGSA